MVNIFKKHYRIERFSVLVCVLLVLLLCVTVVCFGKNVEKNKIQMTNQAKYTSSFTTSVSSNSGTVSDVFVNSDKTRAFVLVKFEKLESLPSSADDYKLYLTYQNVMGNKCELDPALTGSWYVFGSTGYMGAYIVNENGFTSQILKLTGRVMKTLNNSSSSSSATSTSNDTFDIYFNPGAAMATVSESLGNSNVEPATLYYEFVGKKSENEIKNTLVADLQKMQTDLTTIDDNGMKLSQQDSIQVPELPSYVKGDSINVDLKSDPISINTVFSEIPAGGYDIDWVNVDITKGECLKTLLAKEGKKADTTYTTYLNGKSTEKKTTSNTSSTSGTKWYFTSGEQFNTSGTDSATKQIASDISSYTSALTSYQTDKNNYFTVDMLELLELEQTIMSLNDVTTHNTSDDAFVLWEE